MISSVLNGKFFLLYHFIIISTEEYVCVVLRGYEKK